MSVLMMLRVSGDAKKLEAFAAANSAALQATAERAKQHGVTRHRFYGNDSEVIVVDEWPDEESFHAFFQASHEIAGYMEAAGVTSEPVITFWRPLDTNDDIG
jgi:heme-degrading monooxygenase HmoA